jgi:hypothetical protein
VLIVGTLAEIFSSEPFPLKDAKIIEELLFNLIIKLPL